jgi:hypothetical protein
MAAADSIPPSGNSRYKYSYTDIEGIYLSQKALTLLNSYQEYAKCSYTIYMSRN